MNYQNNAIILGGNALNCGIVDVLKKLNLNIIVVDFRESIDLENDMHIVFDAKDPNVTKVLREKHIDNVKIVYTSMDNAGLAQRAICKEYGLKFSSEKSMTNAHYKNKMHEIWNKEGILNRKSIALQEFNFDKIKEINNNYKTIIKPSDSCASRGITIIDKNSNKEVLEKAFNIAKENSTNSFVNIEEFVEGTEFTVDMLGDDYGNVSVFGISKKYHTKNISNNKVAVKLHYNASDVPHETMNKIAEFGIKCYKALGLKSTLGHLEILLKNNGEISPVEIGARSSGFIASHLAQVGTNLIYLEEYLKVLNGGKVQNGLLPHSNTSSMYYFYDLPSNIVSKQTTNIMDFLNPEIKSLYHDRTNLKANKIYKDLTQDTDRYGYEILVGPKEKLTIIEVEKVEKNFIQNMFYED